MIADMSIRAAELYDWNNEQRLRAQLADVDFWTDATADADRVLVVGCGTGRVSHGLDSRIAGTVFGVDLDPGRVAVASRNAAVRVIVGDARMLPFRARSVDAVIFPYSVFQLLASYEDRRSAIQEASRVTRPGATIWIDVSQNFERRGAAARSLVATGWSVALHAEVREWETVIRLGDALEIRKEFEIVGEPSLSVTERWMFASGLGLNEIAQALPLRARPTRHGYGTEASAHRLIHAFTRIADGAADDIDEAD